MATAAAPLLSLCVSDEAEGHEPIVAVRAILAERVIQEKDDSLSIIRIIDKLKLTATRVGPNPQIAPQTDLEPVDVRFPVVAHLAVLVRQIDGPPTTQQLELEITGPDGTSILKAAPVDVALAVGRGVNLITPVAFTPLVSGRYLVKAALGGTAIDVVPFEIEMDDATPPERSPELSEL